MTAAAAAAAAAAAPVDSHKQLFHKIPLAEKAAYYLSIPDSKFAQMCPEIDAEGRAQIVQDAVSDVVSDLTHRTVFEFDEILFRFAVPRAEFLTTGFHRRLVASVRSDARYQTHRAVDMLVKRGAPCPFFLDCVYTLGDEQLCVSARPMYSMQVVQAFIRSLGLPLKVDSKEAWVTRVAVRRDTMSNCLIDGHCESKRQMTTVYHNCVSIAHVLGLQQFPEFAQVDLYPENEVKNAHAAAVAASRAPVLKIPGPTVKVPTPTGPMFLRKLKVDAKDIDPPIGMCDD